MRHRSLIRLLMLALVALLVAACEGPPPTQYVLVVTATPDPNATEPAGQVIVVTATPDEPAAPSATLTMPPSETRTPTPEDAAANPSRATQTAQALIPTPTVRQIQVAEQRFQNGRMFWLEPIDQIWVMVNDSEGRGSWTIHEDNFEEGDIEFDPDIMPPPDLLQPERGFGRLWRDNDEVRDALGWALEPEIGFVSNYEFQPQGFIEDGEFVIEPSYHIVTSFYGEVFRFNEINATWQQILPD